MVVSLYFGVEKATCFKWWQNGDLLGSPENGSRIPRNTFGNKLLDWRVEVLEAVREFTRNPTQGPQKEISVFFLRIWGFYGDLLGSSVREGNRKLFTSHLKLIAFTFAFASRVPEVIPVSDKKATMGVLQRASPQELIEQAKARCLLARACMFSDCGFLARNRARPNCRS